ncbi:MAG: type IV secretory system conjugative DNA transfer family protein, partial [Patescibacteria group bacterium]|nr:type IV secretory system conjugative DNA transfer family protein [Patescibacteria group bacterium]
ITKIQLAAMERVRIPEQERKDFYLYVDEFQNFVTDSFANILSEARKYRLSLVIAHQYIGQLATKDSTVVRDAIFGNVGTMIVFRVGAADAEFLEKELEPDFTIEDVVNLPNRQIYLKLMVDGVTSRPFSANTLPPLNVSTHENNHEAVFETSRKLYAKKRNEVEEEIYRWSGMAMERRQQFEKRTDGEKRQIAGAPTMKKYAPRGDFRPKPMTGIQLGEIGIEFEPPKRKTLTEKFKKFEEKPQSQRKEISLTELKKTEPAKREFIKKESLPKKPVAEPQIDELKEAIKKAIEEI